MVYSDYTHTKEPMREHPKTTTGEQKETIRIGEWEVLTRNTILSPQHKTDLDDIYREADAEISKLSDENTGLLTKLEYMALTKVLGAFLALAAPERGEPDMKPSEAIENLGKGDLPVLLYDTTGTRILGICIVRRQKEKDWKPRDMRSSLVGAPLSNSYEIAGAYLRPEVRGALTVLPRLVSVIKKQIEKYASKGDGTHTESHFVYFDRPRNAPLSPAAISQFNIAISPASVPHASPEKRGFVRYALQLETDANGQVQSVPWNPPA